MTPPLPTVETVIGEDGQPCYQVTISGHVVRRHDRWQVDCLLEQLYADQLPADWYVQPLGSRAPIHDTDPVCDPGV
jgi:hypothetical protein